MDYGLVRMAWISFLFSTTFCLLIFYLPLPMLLRSGNSCIASAALSPLISTALLCLIGVLLGIADIHISGTGLLLTLVCVCIVIYVIVNRLYPKSNIESSEYSLLFIYLFVGVVVCSVFFIMPLNGPDSFVQYSDNIAHLSRIQAMIDDGAYSILETGSYPLNLPSSQIPVDSSRAFYPAGISVVSALLAAVLNISVPLAQNVVIYVYMATVFPFGSCYFISNVFEDDRISVILGAFAIFMFAAFPFGLLLYGPLYPNVVSMCCVPATAAGFMDLIASGVNWTRRALLGAIFLTCSFALCALQPNSVFLLAVILGPYCCSVIYRRIQVVLEGKRFGRFAAFFASSLFAVFALGVWTACYLAPSFQPVVIFRWESLYTVSYAIWSLISFGLRRNLPQYVVAIAVMFGFVSVLFDKKRRWLAYSFSLMGLIYIVGISTEGVLKQYLAGFWYTDPYRTSASVAITAAPLALIGLRSAYSAIEQMACYRQERFYSIFAVLFGSFALVTNVIFPNFAYPKKAFAEVYSELTDLNNLDDDKLLNYSESSFLKQALNIIGDDLVLNDPFDGSVYAYPLYGMNVYFKSINFKGETEDAVIIGESASDYGIDSDITSVIDRTNARYIILLDKANYIPMNDSMLYSQYTLYPFRQWTGFEEISADSPYFTLVLDDGINKLYRINR